MHVEAMGMAWIPLKLQAKPGALYEPCHAFSCCEHHPKVHSLMMLMMISQHTQHSACSDTCKSAPASGDQQASEDKQASGDQQASTYIHEHARGNSVYVCMHAGH